MSVPIVCPDCGAPRTSDGLEPGSSISCESCGGTLRVPAHPTPESPPVVQPTAKPPVVQPTAKPPVVQPSAKPQVVQPSAKPQVVQPAPRSAPESRSGASTANPAPRRRTTGRRPTTRTHTRVVPTSEIRQAPQKKGKRGVVIASAAAVALLTVVGIFAFGGGGTGSEEEISYAAGYGAGVELRVRRALGFPRQKGSALFREFKADYDGTARHPDFMTGLEHGRDDTAPTLDHPRLRGDLILRTAESVLTETRERYDGAQDVAGAWEAAQALEAARSSDLASAHEGLEKLLNQEHQRAVNTVLAGDPSHAGARESRGQVLYERQLLDLAETPLLAAADREAALSEHQKLKAIADKDGGWLNNTNRKRMEAFRARYSGQLARIGALKGSPFFAKAEAMKEEIGKDLKELFKTANDKIDQMVEQLPIPEDQKAAVIEGFTKSLEGLEGRQYEAVLNHPPYVMFVEKESGWDVDDVADKVLSTLASLNELFLASYQEKFGLDSEQTDPIPVLYFRSAEAYQQYLFASQGTMNPNVLAHFEPETGRLCIHDETGKSTIMHEGTHQLFWYHGKVKADFNDQSFWFQEGVAEWFSGHRRWVDEDGDWAYELGLLQEQRIQGIRMLVGRGDIYKLEDLITLTFGDRNNGRVNPGLVYAQGWMLIYFLNYFDLDNAGNVRIDTAATPVEGRYHAVWEKMLGYVLTGKDGAPHTGERAFLDAAGVATTEQLAEMADQFDRYQRWLSNKIKFKQHKDKRLIPWDQHRDSRGRKVGQASDDRFPDTREREGIKVPPREEGDKDG